MPMEEPDINELLEKLQTETWTPGEILHYGPESRTISIWSDITNESVLSIISQLLELEHREPGKPIRIHLCTEGGSLAAALALYDAIRMISSPTIITATGICASAGLLILVAGDKRFCTKNTQFFYHQPIMPGESAMTSSEMVTETANAYICQQTNYDKIIMTRCGLTNALWRRHFKGKTAKYFCAEEAVAYGLVHEALKHQGE